MTVPGPLETRASTGATKRLAFATLLALAACAAPQDSYRDSAAPIGATTRFDPAEFAGSYRVVASFAPQGTQPKRRDISFVVNDSGGLTMQDGARTQSLDLVAPGRLRPSGSTSDQDIWVFWSDADYRTAALGTPSGSFGMILERGNAAPDRMRAAREILDWYGYDLARLAETR